MSDTNNYFDNDGIYSGPTTLLGDMELYGIGNKIRSLGSLQKVTGSLKLSNCHYLTDLGDLHTVGGSLQLYNLLRLTDLGYVESVGGGLDLKKLANLTSLGAVDSVGSLSVMRIYLKDYGNLCTVHGSILLDSMVMLPPASIFFETLWQCGKIGRITIYEGDIYRKILKGSLSTLMLLKGKVDRKYWWMIDYRIKGAKISGFN